MKKEYKMPQMEAIEMKTEAYLLDGSNTATQTGPTVTVDEWEEDDD